MMWLVVLLLIGGMVMVFEGERYRECLCLLHNHRGEREDSHFEFYLRLN